MTEAVKSRTPCADGIRSVADGYRESERSWRELLLDVQACSLIVDPRLATLRCRRMADVLGANRKRVQRLMRLMRLEAIYPRRRTT